MTAWIVYLVLLRATVTSFSGMTSVPIIRDDLVVRHAVVTDAQLNAALAIGQASPGPAGIYIVTVGYFAAGVPGAIAGIAALATPALLANPMLGVLRLGRADLVAGAAQGIVLAASVLTVVTAFGLAGDALSNGVLVAIAAGALVVVAADRVAPLWIIALSGVVAALV
jgi:chromate transporter